MGGERTIERTIRRYVGGLSEKEAKEQLSLAFLQMERCQKVLRGEDAEPVAMMDNGLSSDLELFYQCRKVYAELSYLNDLHSDSGMSDGEILITNMYVDGEA